MNGEPFEGPGSALRIQPFLPQVLAGLEPLRLLRGHGDNGQSENVAARFDQIHHLLVSRAFDVHVIPASRNDVTVSLPLSLVPAALDASVISRDTDFNRECSVPEEPHRLRFSIHSHCNAVM